MPGAYTKVPNGPRYERMVLAITDCRNQLEAYLQAPHNKKLHTPTLAPLIHELHEWSKPCIEDFFYAGGLQLFCALIEAKCSHPINDAENRNTFEIAIDLIFNVLEVLLSILHDPFDDDIGEIPLLVFFLCQRHEYYVDIHWLSKELTYMITFTTAFMTFLNTNSTQTTDEEYIRAVNILYGSLLHFSPHRVSAAMAEAFTTERCHNLFLAIQNRPDLFKTPKACCRVLELLVACASFGFSWSLAEKLPYNLLMWSIFVNSNLGIRCPCNRCELPRRIIKVARERDEIGIVEAQASKKAICTTLIKAGGLELVCKILEKASGFLKNMKLQTPSAESESATTAIDEAVASNGSLVETDKILELASVFICLCSLNVAQELQSASILKDQYAPLLTAIIKAINLSDIRKIYNPVSIKFLPGAKSLLMSLCSLILMDSFKTQDLELFQKTSSTIEPILQFVSQLIVNRFHENLIDFKSEMCENLPLLCAFLLCRHKLTNSFAALNLSTSSTNALDALTTSSITVCQIFVDAFELHGFRDDSDTFIACLLLSMFILVGGVEYSSIPTVRRRFIKAPNVLCGWMANGARSLSDAYVKNHEGCIIVKSLASVIISQAEKACAILPAPSQCVSDIRKHLSNQLQKEYITTAEM